MTNSKTSSVFRHFESFLTNGYDLMILIPVIILLGLGLVFVYSASSAIAAYSFGDSNYFLKRQAIYCIVGLGLMILIKSIPSSMYAKIVYPFLTLSFCFLILLHFPGMATRVGGAKRWLSLGTFSFQPSELAKFSISIYMAYSIAKEGERIKSFFTGIIPNLIVPGTFILLLAAQPDIGTATTIAIWVFVILFAGGASILHLFTVFAISAPIAFWSYLEADYRLKRLVVFLYPWEDPSGVGYQIVHSFLAVGSGGVFGVGLGRSYSKLFYLAEPHEAFIFAVIGEEMGLIGMTIILILFGLLIVRGITIALQAKNLFSTFLALGLSFMIGLEVILNTGMVLGLLPPGNRLLPFISYGGANLIFHLAYIGILLNIAGSPRE